MERAELKQKEHVLELHVCDFEGPLDLLLHLIAQNKVDIYDIPIAEITAQYLAILEEAERMDLGLASDFLLMAATLTQIKSRLLLPSEKKEDGTEEDPREELVLKLLAYQRCKWIAGKLERRFAAYARTVFKLPETAKSLGLEPERRVPDPSLLNRSLFDEACAEMERRNAARYQDVQEKNAYILRRDRFSVKKALYALFAFAKRRGRFLFEQFSVTKNKAEKISHFLALLELVKQSRIRATQTGNFAPIELEWNAERGGDTADFEKTEEIP